MSSHALSGISGRSFVAPPLYASEVEASQRCSAVFQNELTLTRDEFISWNITEQRKKI